MILTKENLTVDEYSELVKHRKKRRIVQVLETKYMIVLKCGTHTLHNKGWSDLNKLLAHREVMLKEKHSVIITPTDDRYYRVRVLLNGWHLHSEKLNLRNAVKLRDELI